MPFEWEPPWWVTWLFVLWGLRMWLLALVVVVVCGLAYRHLARSTSRLDPHKDKEAPEKRGET